MFYIAYIFCRTFKRTSLIEMPRNVEHCRTPVTVKPVKIDNQSPGTSTIDTMNTKILLMQAAAARDSCYDAQSYDKSPATDAFTNYTRQQTTTFLIAIAAGLAGICIIRAFR
jgi:hypothetical protein